MARHAENTLRGTGISKVLNLALAVPAPEAVGTEGLVSSENGQVLNLVAAVVAAVCAVIAYQGPIAEEQEVGVGIEECTAGVAAEAVNVPSVPSYEHVSAIRRAMRCGLGGARGRRYGIEGCIPSSKAFPSSRI